MRKPKMDDWQHARKILSDANAARRNIKHNAVKDIGKGIIKHYRLPLYKLNNDGSYKLDKNGDKIPKYRERHNKKNLVTRKPVSFKDLTSYYLIAPKIASIAGMPVSVIKAVQAVGLIKLHHSLLNKPYDLDKIIKNEQQDINDLTNSQQKDQASNKSDTKDSDKQVAEKVAHQTDQDHTSTDDNDSDSKDSNDDQQSNSNQNQDKKFNDDNGSTDNDTLNNPDPNNLGNPTTDAPDFKNM